MKNTYVVARSYSHEPLLAVIKNQSYIYGQ